MAHVICLRHHGDGVKISYYRVNENDDTLTPAKKCVEAGRYLYEIQLTDEAAERYDIKNRYVYSAHYAADPKTPNIDEYDNIGFMDIRTAYTAGKNVGTYSVTPYGLSSDKYDITYEPGTITVEPKTLTASDFTVTAENRTYDGSLDANVTAAANVSGITATAEGAFLDANAGSYLVRYEITDDSFKGSGSDVLYINKAQATISAKDNMCMPQARARILPLIKRRSRSRPARRKRTSSRLSSQLPWRD